MSNIKQAPFLGLTGMGGGGTGLALGGAVAKKTYIDDLFSTFLTRGNQTTRSVNTGIDMTEGGLVWSKSRTATHSHFLFDTERGVNKFLRADGSNDEYEESGSLTAFNSNGFSLGTWTGVNQSNEDHSHFSFRKQKGFFDLVTWTQSGSDGSARTIDHNLGCVPGFIMLKQTTGSESWICWHRELGTNDYLKLNQTAAAGTDANASVNSVSATQFVVGADNNKVGSYVAYLFAGGESTAATARSVTFPNTASVAPLEASTSYPRTGYDFGTGDFTIECWAKFLDSSTNILVDKRTSSATNALVLYIDNSVVKFFQGGSDRITSSTISKGQWYHISLARSSGTTKMFVNGVLQGSHSDTYDYDSTAFHIGGEDNGANCLNGSISNLRVVKGTAVYTSSFRPPTEPLTNITNTVLLCCNNSSITGTTVGNIQEGSSGAGAAASTDSPFDDPNGFKFGEGGDQNLIKCGSYIGQSGANTVNLEWEPQWVIVKNVDSSEPWVMVDSMRGWANESSGVMSLKANSTSTESAYNNWGPNATGWELDLNNREIDQNDQNYIYIAILMSDGYVAKPEDAGTDSWTSSNYDSTAPAFNANFPVDFALFKRDATYDWRASGRLFAKTYLKANNTSAVSNEGDYVFDYNDGWNEQTGYSNTEQSWMWKRGPGFDVVRKLKSVNRHNLAQPPEMVWTKRMDNGSAEWYSWHKDLGGGGSNAVGYHVKLNENHGESNSNVQLCPIGDALPTATHFRTGTDSDVRSNSSIAFLFASVTGISKCGTYSGSSSAFTLNLGFQPRIIIIKGRDADQNWIMFDTTTGWAKTEMGGAETTKYWALNDNGGTTVPAVVSGSNIVCYPVSTGVYFTGLQNSLYGRVNLVGKNYVYYAHA